eukprot:CAMPEP_0115053956 /NCGR_PEP_ID=MMETSP0227-20121206/3817_1 /TAXON_ID=89957 /ORGANISM="Polarella glacialis, Strain CCMP 1383" /LENGTH=109 /DNA_ID=CAMNT_0002438359 /DNA_START=87 /DNA_END=416 /DNA_ORIENTATION=+
MRSMAEESAPHHWCTSNPPLALESVERQPKSSHSRHEMDASILCRAATVSAPGCWAKAGLDRSVDTTRCSVRSLCSMASLSRRLARSELRNIAGAFRPRSLPKASLQCE